MVQWPSYNTAMHCLFWMTTSPLGSGLEVWLPEIRREAESLLAGSRPPLGAEKLLARLGTHVRMIRSDFTARNSFHDLSRVTTPIIA